MLLRLGYCAAVIHVVANSDHSLKGDDHLVPEARPEKHSEITLEIADELKVDDLVSFLQEKVAEASRRGSSKRMYVVTKPIRQMSSSQRHSNAMHSKATHGESWLRIVMLAVLLPLFVIFAAYMLLQMLANQGVFDKEEDTVDKSMIVEDKITATKGSTEQSAEAVSEKRIGAVSRMTKLPPTAGPRTEGVAESPASTSVSSTSFAMSPLQSLSSSSKKGKLSSQLPSLPEEESRTSFEDESKEKKGFPPRLTSDPRLSSQVSLASTDSACSSWYLSHESCQELRHGGTVEVNGSPSFHARLERNDNRCHLEVSRTPSWEAPEAIIGPFCWPELSNSEAKIIGPSGEEYGLFAKRGQSFGVSHKSKVDSDVLILDPVMTTEGCPVLEVLAGDGMPLGSARLNEEDEDVEIDADPDVDSALIVSCVLASFLSNPTVFTTTPQSSPKGSPRTDI